MRRLCTAFVGALLVSCGTPPAANRTDGYSTATPAITGHSALISSSELAIALRAARIKLATLAPRSPIFRVVVVSASRIEAYYWAEYNRDNVELFYQNDAPTGYLILERVSNGWRVLPGREPKTLNLDNVIITSSSRSNQSLAAVRC
jgi:hypothetical protein